VPTPVLTPPIAPNAEVQGSGVGTKTKAKPSGKGHDLPLGQIASIILAVSAVGFFLFILRDMPHLMIFLLTWGVMIAVLRKASGVIAFGGGLIVATIVLLLAAIISPIESGAGRVSEDDRGESREVPKTSATVSGEYTITGDNFTGFSNRKDEDRATELSSDTEAFSKFFLACVMTKRATLFKKGETVILEEFGGFADSKLKLRRKGELVGYWTNREAID
jgi:hypothetical protein